MSGIKPACMCLITVQVSLFNRTYVPTNLSTLCLKKGCIKLIAVTLSNLNGFSKNSFTGAFLRKFVVKRLLKILPHLKCIPTLPCEIFLPEIVIFRMYKWNETSFKMHSQFQWISFTYILFPTSVQLTTRYGASSSSECVSHRCTTLTKVKHCLVHVWHSINQTVIDNAFDEWCGRLCACVRAKGGHFEQMSWQY